MRRFLDWLLGLFAPATPVTPPLPGIPGGFSAAVVAAMNARRARAGLPPLRDDDRLLAVAASFAAELARRDILTHYGADGSTPWGRLTRAGYAYTTAGENAAEGETDPEAVVALWMGSPGHRANILGPFAAAGAGLAVAADGNAYVVADFAIPAGGVA